MTHTASRDRRLRKVKMAISLAFGVIDDVDIEKTVTETRLLADGGGCWVQNSRLVKQFTR